jgi:hypothetical protein
VVVVVCFGVYKNCLGCRTVTVLKEWLEVKGRAAGVKQKREGNGGRDEGLPGLGGRGAAYTSWRHGVHVGRSR